MAILDWKVAEQRLNEMISGKGDVDIYFIMNVIAPLRTRLYNGDRSLRLYNAIMNIRTHYFKTHFLQHTTSTRR